VTKQSLRPVRRDQTPAIAWSPAHDAYYVLAGVLRTATFPLQVAQSALIELEAHLGQNNRPLPFGLLAGGLYSCSQSKLVYVLVETVIPSGIDLTPDDPQDQLAAELRSLTAEAKKRGKLVLGWYLGGMDPQLELDPEVDGVHRELFPEQWQVVLVRDGSAGSGNGAFMRFEGIGNKYYPIPFSEVLSKKAAREKTDVRRTAVRWANYRTTETVSPLDAPAAAEITAANGSESLSSGKRLKEWLEPLRRAVYGAPTRHEPVARAVDARPTTSVAVPRRASHASPQWARPTSPPPTSPPPTLRSLPPVIEDEVRIEPDRPIVELDRPTVEPDRPIAEPDRPKVEPAPEMAHAAVEVSAPATHQLFINGELITFSKLAADDVEEDQLTSQWNRRSIVMPALAALALLVAVGLLMLVR
jgi:hypothetical protein